MIQVEILYSDESKKTIEIPDDYLSTLQEIVGGDIEVAKHALDKTKVLIVNEGGKLWGMDFNKQATDLYSSAENGWDVLLGNVVVMSKKDFK